MPPPPATMATVAGGGGGRRKLAYHTFLTTYNKNLYQTIYREVTHDSQEYNTCDK